MRERTKLETSIGAIRRLRAAVDDNVGLIEMAEAEKDEATIAECEKALREATGEAKAARLETLLSGEADANNAYIEINAGAGGTEAQDWAEMLARMYTRWAERRGYKVSWLEESAGEEAGIKSCAYKVEGPNAYGWLKTESGVHRLVRISPFDGNARRQTSFASVWVYPEVDDNIEIELVDKDLRVDTYRASGAGGQHVNKTDSAVRITHLPTGIAVAVQQERSQHQNRAKAIQMLKARLYEVELQKREAERLEAEASKTDIGWGHQIRSYVLQPYQMVKDLRVDVYMSSGAGGQHVNKTASAVRITHLPTGIAVAMQEERSQHQNRAKAMKLLRSRIYEGLRERADNERSADRRAQVGSGDRSERIRTYNFPQGRVTDHRINLTLYKLPDIVSGAALDEIIDPLILDHQAALLAQEGM